MPKKTDNIVALSMPELRERWRELWGLDAHRFISRPMLEKSIFFKQVELAGQGLNPEQQIRLKRLIKQYNRDTASFDQKDTGLKPGARLVKIYRGKKHIITVKDNGHFDYGGMHYSSLSKIALDITGTRWNGWLFFGLKKEKQK